MLLIHPESHLDHELSGPHLSFILNRFRDRTDFFIETVKIPDSLPDLECRLYGPLMGDAPIEEELVTYQVRPNRAGPSRIIARPPRRSRLLTVIAGPVAEWSCVLYTAYGGPKGATKEVWELEKGSPERMKSESFWSEHALSAGDS